MKKARSTPRGYYRVSVWIILCAITLVNCSPKAPSSSTLTPITIQLSWLHQAEYAGLYAADQLGYFADERLDISFLEGGPEVDFISPVLNGDAQFGIAQPADVIFAGGRQSGTQYRRDLPSQSGRILHA